MNAVAADVDGRHLRREQNREAVLDALLAMFREGVYEPTSNEIAERAGLSPRSLFRYFDDIDELRGAVAERQMRRARSLVDLAVGADEATATKIARLVEARARLFEEIAPAARAARACAHRHPNVAEELQAGRAYLRRQLRDLFRPELEAAGAGVLPAIDALCSFESYELIRFDHGLSRAKTVAALVAALAALLERRLGGR